MKRWRKGPADDAWTPPADYQDRSAEQAPAPAPPPEPEPEHENEDPNLVVVSMLTTRGIVRSGNEDTVGALGWIAPMEQPTPVALLARGPLPLVIAVADGLGGHAAGEVASRYAIARLMDSAPSLGTPEAVRSVLRSIHQELKDRGASTPGYGGMGTTIAALIVTQTMVLCAHVGDSRVYYTESGLLDQLTLDDAVAGALQQCLGGRPGSPMEPHVRELRRDISARYLICSDGLHGCVPREVIGPLAAIDDELDAAAALANAAAEAGAPDNVSLCLVKVPRAAIYSAPPA